MKEIIHWTPEEIAILIDGYKTGMTAKLIAVKIGRTERAVLAKAKKLKISVYNKRSKYRGCNDDCFNCPYHDCLKPCGTF